MNVERPSLLHFFDIAGYTLTAYDEAKRWPIFNKDEIIVISARLLLSYHDGLLLPLEE